MEQSRALKYYYEHREERLQKQREYYRKNREKCAESSKRYHKEVLQPKLDRQRQGLEPADELFKRREYQRMYYETITKPGRELAKKMRKEKGND